MPMFHFDRKTFFDGLRANPRLYTVFDRGTVAAVEFLLTAFEDAEECREGSPQVQVSRMAYMLATVRHETAGTFEPVRETLATSDAQAIARLDRAWVHGKLPWVKTPYWRNGWFGRGYVQLTHRENYRLASERLGVDLLLDPSLALARPVAVQILIRGMFEGWFTDMKFDDVITETKTDYWQARRIINGMDRAIDIAAYAVTFCEILFASRVEGERPTINTAE